MMTKERTFEAKKNELIGELMLLRIHEGCTPARMLSEAPALVVALGGEEQGVDRLFTRFKSLLDSLPDQKSVDMLRASYGFFPEHAGSTLRKRRDSYRRVSNKNYATQEKCENAVIRVLAITLLTYDKNAVIPP